MSRPPCARSCASSRYGSAFGSGKRGSVKRRKGFRRHHPGRNRRGEILAEERTQRLGFPGLNVARRPVVEEAIAKNVICRRADREGATQVGGRTDKCAELQFEIETLRRAEARRRTIHCFALSARPRHCNVADPHRGCPAVI